MYLLLIYDILYIAHIVEGGYSMTGNRRPKREQEDRRPNPTNQARRSIADLVRMKVREYPGAVAGCLGVALLLLMVVFATARSTDVSVKTDIMVKVPGVVVVKPLPEPGTVGYTSVTFPPEDGE